jgi:hypothetical protein
MSEVSDVASGDWVRRYDEASGYSYYANAVTRKSVWEQPVDWVISEFLEPNTLCGLSKLC